MQENLDKLRERYVTSPVRWTTIIGLVLLIIGAFGAWKTASAGPIEVSQGGFDENGTLTFVLAIAALAAIAAYVYTTVRIQQSALLWGLVVGAVVIDLLVLLDFLDVMTEEVPEGVDIGVGWGLWVSIVGAILLTIGAIVPMWGEIRSRAQGARS